MKKNRKIIRIGSDFSGVGAFEEAIKRLNIPFINIFACDIDRHARTTYLKNHAKPLDFPFNVYERNIPKKSLDIYMTSPPCQSFSIAGIRKGEKDKRGVLFYNSLEFIKKNRPRYFIFENVKGLLSDNNGETFRKWINLLGGKSINGLPVIFPNSESVNYHVYYKILNSKNYGVPQNRERIFIVGIRDDKDNNFSFPKEYPLTKTLNDVLEKETSKKYYIKPFILQNFLKKKATFNLKIRHEKTKIAACITTKSGSRITDNFIYTESIKNIKKPIKQVIEIKKVNSVNTLTLIKKDSIVLNMEKIRKLTPRECFRLMGYRDSFIIDCVSETQAYKQAGNSIVVNILENILKKLVL